MNGNLLIKSDNLIALQWMLDNGYEGKIDLVYIDPPFATGGTFKVEPSGRAATISLSHDAGIAYKDDVRGEDFITFLRKRVQLIHRLLSDKGSLYLHIDYKIGHYVKIMLDEVFGVDNFKNDITRIKCNPKNFERVGYGNIKDMILFYTKTNTPIWNHPKKKCSEAELARTYKKIDAQGRRYTTVPIHAPGETKNGDSGKPFKGLLPPKGRHWRRSIAELEALDAQGLIEWSSTGNPRLINYADDHLEKKIQDIWEFKDPSYPVYPTEKNGEMLASIVKASSNEGSIVMDCFCGSGSTLKAAADSGRRWIGVDKADIAIQITKNRFNKEGDNGDEIYTYMEM